MKLSKFNCTSEAGFTAVETILSLALVVAVGATGFFAYRAHNNVDSKTAAATSPVATATPDITASWKSYTLKNEKVSFKYPASYTVKDTSSMDDDGTADPHTDSLTLTKANTFTITIIMGATGIGGSCTDCKLVKVDPVMALGQNLTLNYVTTADGETIILSDDPKSEFGFSLMTKNIVGKNLDDGGNGKPIAAGVYAAYTDSKGGTLNPPSSATLTKDAAEFKQIVSTMHY